MIHEPTAYETCTRAETRVDRQPMQASAGKVENGLPPHCWTCVGRGKPRENRPGGGYIGSSGGHFILNAAIGTRKHAKQAKGTELGKRELSTCAVSASWMLWTHVLAFVFG